MASNSQKAIVLIGLQGIGKSTYCRKNFSKSEYQLCVKDDIRFLIYPNDLSFEETFPHEKTVVKIHQMAIDTALELGKIPVIDETHVSKKHRMAMLDYLKYHYPGIEVEAHVFPIDLDLALERNAKRSGKRFVPEEVIRRCYRTLVNGLRRDVFKKKYTILALKEEGFDNVVMV